jgi:hypothetical protein
VIKERCEGVVVEREHLDVVIAEHRERRRRAGDRPCSNDGTLPFGAGFPALATAVRTATSSTLGATTDLFAGLGSVHREWSLVPQG